MKTIIDKARYVSEPKPVTVMRTGCTLHVFLALNAEQVTEEDGSTYWLADYAEFTARVGELDLDDLRAHPEKYLGRKVDAQGRAELYSRSVQAWMDTKVHERLYDNVDSTSKYLGCPDAVFAAEAAAVQAWVSAVWRKSYELQADILAGKMDEPESPEEFIALLPTLVWPDEQIS